MKGQTRLGVERWANDPSSFKHLLLKPDTLFKTVMGSKKWDQVRPCAKDIRSRRKREEAFLRRGRQPEENISRARTVVSPRFLY